MTACFNELSEKVKDRHMKEGAVRSNALTTTAAIKVLIRIVFCR
jgi:hypothetical protein